MVRSVLSGALRRRNDGWYWSDGQPEPRVRDMSIDRWNFRRNYFGRVEVLETVAKKEPALQWVLNEGYPLIESSDGINAAYYVPVDVWDDWVAKHSPAGVKWFVRDESKILDRAYALGWRPARPYVARDTGKVYS
jgi:hypothetical protein